MGAIQMKKYLKNSVIYQVFPRNFSINGDFKGVIDKINYIKDLGANIIQLTPVCEIGEKNRKGTLGSPYSIKDYNSVNHEYGNKEDFKKLAQEIHKNGLKLILDIVYNHTSRDSFLLKMHPHWYYHDNNGNFNNKLGDWNDVYDLNYNNNDDLIEYLIDSLQNWIDLGADGFRFDVASLISKNLFIQIKSKLLLNNPETIMIAESVHYDFINYARMLNFNALSDSELYENGFDVLYTYNSRGYFDQYFKTKKLVNFNRYKTMLKYEEATNPSTCLRIRGYENHDSARIIELTKDLNLMKTIAIHDVMLKGPSFICMGLETKQNHHITLFEKDLMNWEIDKEWYQFVKKIIQIKKDPKNLEITTSNIIDTNDKTLIIKNYFMDKTFELGIFNFYIKEIEIHNKELIDGKYINKIDDSVIEIKNNSLKVYKPLILKKF